MLVVIQCDFFIINYSHLSVVIGVWTTFSIDGGKMPLDWKFYDLGKLNFFLMCHELQQRE